MRGFAHACVISWILYGLLYHPVNRTRSLALDRFMNETRRLITGLFKYTRLGTFKSFAGINGLSELVATHYRIEEERLHTTHAGRQILEKLDYAVNDLRNYHHGLLRGNTLFAPTATLYPHAHKVLAGNSLPAKGTSVYTLTQRQHPSDF